MMNRVDNPMRRFRWTRPLLATALMGAVLLAAGCGDKKSPDKAASQTAAKVNSEEITVHQINFVLQQRRVASGQAASASRQALEYLVDQELAVQKAQEQKLDRDPKVVQQMEAARREILARAYAEKIATGASKPSTEEVKAYYDAHPLLFKERKVYSLQEIGIQARPEQIDGLRGRMGSAKDVTEFLASLKTMDVKFGSSQVVRAAEQLPMTSLERLAAMKDGQMTFVPTPGGAQVLVVLTSRVEPVDEARATPAIEQFLLNERRRKLVADDAKALRASAKIVYAGEYAAGGGKDATPAVAASEPALVPAASAASGSMAGAAPQIEVVPSTTSAPPVAPASSTVLERGLKGFK